MDNVQRMINKNVSKIKLKEKVNFLIIKKNR
jgi:hypothetical protein